MLLKRNVICSSIIYNWIGELRLYFGMCRGRTILIDRWHRGPFYVQKPFYPEGNKVPHVYLLHPPGGLVGGDQLFLRVVLKTGSHVLLTMPGANKFYRSNGNYVYLKQRFILKKDSILEWLPQTNIFFPRSKVIIDIKFQVSRGVRFIVFETLCFNFIKFPDNNGILDICLSISLENCVGLREHVRINYSDEPILNKFWGYQISATLFAMPCDIRILSNVRVLIASYHMKMSGVTLLDDLLIVRILDNDNELIKTLLHDLWSFLRPDIIGKKSVFPRVWLT